MGFYQPARLIVFCALGAALLQGGRLWASHEVTLGRAELRQGAPAQAADHFRLASLLGNAAAKANLGLLYQQGKVLPRDEAKAEQLFATAAAAGDPLGEYQLGQSQLLAGAADAAIISFQRSAAHDNPDAELQLAALYANPSPKQDLRKAESLYTQAIAHPGMLAGRLALADFYVHYQYRDGLQKANDLLRADAEAGNLEAELALARLNGSGPVAVHWYERAANQGNVDAALKLANMYEYGGAEIGRQDFATARVWLQKAAAMGSGDAMDQLSQLYMFGDIDPRTQQEISTWDDQVQSMAWKRKAAAAGFPKAVAELPGRERFWNWQQTCHDIYLGRDRTEAIKAHGQDPATFSCNQPPP